MTVTSMPVDHLIIEKYFQPEQSMPVEAGDTAVDAKRKALGR
jgi:hypothetical protein